MRRAITIGSIGAVLILILVSFNQVVNVEAAKTGILSKSNISINFNKIIKIFQQREHIDGITWYPGYFLIITIAYLVYYGYPVFHEIFQVVFQFAAMGAFMFFYWFLWFFAALQGPIHFPSPY